MLVSVTAAMAGPVIAIGLIMAAPAQALPPEGGGAGPAGLQTVQYGEGHTAKPGYGRRHGRKLGPKEPPPHGFVASCQWLRARALTSHNPAWWHKYRQCVGR